MVCATPFVSLFMLAAVAFLALASLTQAQTAIKPECLPLHTLYKTWVADCIKNGIPTADSDPVWKPCICKPGFFPLAVANERCSLDGTTKQPQITEAAMDVLCKNQTGYVSATQQQPDAQLSPALASSTSISQAAAAPTASPGTNGAGMMTGLDSKLATLVSFAAVVLATAAAF